MIVDTHSDINVYKDLVQGQMNTGETSCPSETPSCCGGGQAESPAEANLLGHDFNEWAGEFIDSVYEEPKLTFIQVHSRYMQ
jgi:arsenite methyltransferase